MTALGPEPALLHISRTLRQFQSAFHDIRHSGAAYFTPFAIGRLKPRGERLGTLAGITGAAAQHDVLSRDYFRIIDDVLPAR